MSLSSRQGNMLLDLTETKNEYLTAGFLAQKYEVSIRTVQSDLTAIKEELEGLDFLALEAIPSKGNHIEIYDEQKLQEYLRALQQAPDLDQLNSRETRMKRIIAILFCTKKSITVQHLADRLFISKSTCMNDLKIVKATLKRYHIEILHHSQSGLSVKGNEVAIRKCISVENIEIFNAYNDFTTIGQEPVKFRKIGDILVNLFTEYHYRISDVALQNLIVHIDIFIRRIDMGFITEKVQDKELEKDMSQEFEMSRKLFEECNRVFQTPVMEAEIDHLAIYLRGKSNYSDDSYITQEIDEFVLETLTSIKQRFGIDFIDNMQLRVSLSLHLIPLLTRLKYNMQLKNELLSSMRKSFQVALDIASSFSYRIQERFGYALIEDEISYLAIYFNSALDTQSDHEGTNKVLIISSLKRSETLLLRERINSWFSSAISELVVEDIYHLKELEVQAFDVICTTEKNQFVSNGLAILISQFPSDDDYRKIKMALDGFDGKGEILSLFKESMTFVGKAKDKQTVMHKLCHLIEDEECEKKTLEEEVAKREAMGGTYFGNMIAMPHPMYPVTHQTQIAVALLENEIAWDDYGNKAKIILLISIQKNNPKAYKIWSYVTEFITNEAMLQAILEDVSYANFMKQIGQLLDTMNWKLHE